MDSTPSASPPSAALEHYVRSLNSHRWAEIAHLMTEDAVFIFSEGTHVGKAAARAAFEKTFAHISDEQYWTTDLKWTAVTPHLASCHYLFHWKGQVGGKEAHGSGRGTTVLLKSGERWLIAHEHLGPSAPG